MLRTAALGVRCSMITVVIYGFEGKFKGKSEYDFNFPEIDDIHKCMLFLKQENDELNFDFATSEITKFGFSDLVDLRGNPIRVEVLNTDGFKRFMPFYEESLEEGSSLVYYPNT